MTRRFSPLFLFVLFACTPAAPKRVAVAPQAQPQLAATAIARRVVLVSFDGLGADALVRQQNLPAFEQLAREGASARVINVNPTLTAPTHVAILTGADPQRSGIVSNRFHVAGTPPAEVARGMDMDSDVETLVEAARRQGKRVGAVSFPTVDNRNARRSADFGLAWTMPLVPARLVHLTRADFKREWVPPTWTARPQRHTSFSPVMRARIEWGGTASLRADIDVIAYDTTNDRVENYDTYFVEAHDREIARDERGWFAIAQQTSAGVAGSWSKLMDAKPSLDVTIYWGAVSRTAAWPASFQSMLDENAGFWPGAADEDLDIDASTFVEQLDRMSDFMTRVQTLTIARMPFDLLLCYQPQIDAAAHEFLGTSDEARVMRAAFVAADRAVAAIGDALDPADALVVTGDHGLTVALRELRVNRLLATRGLGSRWRGFTAGSVAHLYRFSEPDDSDAVVNMLTETQLCERIEKTSAASHRNSGDVVCWGWPDVAMNADDTGPVTQTPKPHGQHGGLNTHRELHPVLFAAGAGVRPGNYGEIAQTSIARFVAGLMGVAAPN